MNRHVVIRSLNRAVDNLDEEKVAVILMDPELAINTPIVPTSIFSDTGRYPVLFSAVRECITWIRACGRWKSFSIVNRLLEHPRIDVNFFVHSDHFTPGQPLFWSIINKLCADVNDLNVVVDIMQKLGTRLDVNQRCNDGMPGLFLLINKSSEFLTPFFIEAFPHLDLSVKFHGDTVLTHWLHHMRVEYTDYRSRRHWSFQDERTLELLLTKMDLVTINMRGNGVNGVTALHN